jgi:hypothetical protein
VPMDQNVDWQQGGSRLINTTGHSTSLTITSMQLNGTGRPVLVHRISVRDEEAVGSNPATPTQIRRDQRLYLRRRSEPLLGASPQLVRSNVESGQSSLVESS